MRAKRSMCLFVSSAMLVLAAGLAHGGGYSTRVLSDNPVGYWRLGELSGTSAADSAGVNTGAYVGAYTLGTNSLLLTDTTNTAVAFSSGYVDIPDAANLNFVSKPFTIETWVKLSGYDGSTGLRRVFEKHDAGSGGYGFDMDQNGIRMLGAVHYSVSASLNTTGAYHVVVVSDGAGTGTIYVNGISFGSGSYTHPNAWTGAALIGAAYGGGSRFPGVIDEVAVYPTNLSGTIIMQHYVSGLNEYTPKTSAYSAGVLSDAPVGYWRLGEPNGYIGVFDSAGSGLDNTGIYVGTPTQGVGGLICRDPDTAVAFGGNGYVRIADNSDLNFTAGQPFTLEAWVKPTGLSSSFKRILDKDNGGVLGYVFDMEIGNLRFIGTAYGPVVAYAFSSTGTYHVVAVSDGVNGSLYVNGQNISGSQAMAINPTTYPLYIGESPSGGGGVKFPGVIDEVAIYATNLSSSVIQTHYDLGKWRPPSGTIFSFH